MKRWRTKSWGAVWAMLLAFESVGAAEPIAAETPWRVFLVCKSQDRHRKGPVTYTASPPDGWMQPDFDDGSWGRYSSDLTEVVGGYGYEQSMDAALICLRTRFGVTEPARVRDLALTLSHGNPFEPLRPIRTVAPRGGTCSGQVVVSGSGPLDGLNASIGPLKHVKGNAVLPAELVRVRYAMQEEDEYFCNALMPQPADGATVQPVWVLVDVPRDQQPGW